VLAINSENDYNEVVSQEADKNIAEYVFVKTIAGCTGGSLMAYFGKYYSSKSSVISGMDAMLGRGRGDVWHPPADIYETDDGVVVCIELPGVSAEDIELYVEGDMLAVRGTRRERCSHCKKSYRQIEIRYGPFERALQLPCPVKSGKAFLQNGVLEVIMPRVKKIPAGIVIIKVEFGESDVKVKK